LKTFHFPNCKIALKVSELSVKKFPYSLTVAFVAAVLIVNTPNVAPAAGQQWLQSANIGIGKDQMLLAQPETSDRKKIRAGKKRPLVNVDNNGVMLKGYDPVTCFKQSRAVSFLFTKGNSMCAPGLRS
jgi:hypothetical protein